MRPEFKSIICVLLLLTIKLGHCSDLKLNNFFRIMAKDNKSSSDAYMEETRVKNRIYCMARCNEGEHCFFALYNAESKLCRIYGPKNKNISLPKWERWTGIDCGKPSIPKERRYTVRYSATTYGSIAAIDCALGRYGGVNGQIRCNSNGHWSQVPFKCRSIPKLNEIKSLEARDSKVVPTCRNVISEPATSELFGPTALCNRDEVLTGCSFTVSGASVSTGVTIANLRCIATKKDMKHKNVVHRSIARCCRIPGIQCEYIGDQKLDKSVFCYKHFQLLDCTCYDSSDGPIKNCEIRPTNRTCTTSIKNVVTDRIAVCCKHETLFCYMKKARPEKGAKGRMLTIRCGIGELMTACSGYSTKRRIKSSMIREAGFKQQLEIMAIFTSPYRILKSTDDQVMDLEVKTRMQSKFALYRQYLLMRNIVKTV